MLRIYTSFLTSDSEAIEPVGRQRRSRLQRGRLVLTGHCVPTHWLKSVAASGKVRGSIFSQPVSRQEVRIMPDYKIAPSILSADFARLGAEVDNVIKSGADIVHFDVMDNHYVPNLTIGPLVCEALRKHGVTAEIDVHLMVKPVDRIIPDFAKAGASYITFHPEASEHIDRSLQLIKGEGCKAGLVFNPATPLEHLKYVIDKVDMVLLMSVNPGFGGQSFITTALDKLREARKIIDASGHNIRLEIDGGVKVDNIREIAAAGADTFVAGSAIFGARRDSDPNDYDTVIKAMRDELAKA
jgi:ribulose-phosphate 3-epimerase